MSSIPEGELLIARIEDAVKLAKSGRVKFIGFLDERRCFEAERFLNKKDIYFSFYGGYDDLDRKILCISEEYVDTRDFPICILDCVFDKNYQLTHRDFLGSLMALNIERETIGDIFISGNRGNVFVKEEVADIIIREISKIGRVGVVIKIVNHPTIVIEKKRDFLSITVKSSRLDGVLSALINSSRSTAVELINAGCCKINYQEIKNVSKSISENDVISVRGYGKYKILDFVGTTKKDRLRITAEVYK